MITLAYLLLFHPAWAYVQQTPIVHRINSSSKVVFVRRGDYIVFKDKLCMFPATKKCVFSYCSKSKYRNGRLWAIKLSTQDVHHLCLYNPLINNDIHRGIYLIYLR